MSSGQSRCTKCRKAASMPVVIKRPYTTPRLLSEMHCCASSLHRESNGTHSIESKQDRVRHSRDTRLKTRRVVFTGVRDGETCRLPVSDGRESYLPRLGAIAPGQQTTARAGCACATLNPRSPAYRCFVALSSHESNS